MRKKKKHKSCRPSKEVKHASKIFEEHENLTRSVIGFRLKDKSKADDIYQDFFVSLATKTVPQNLGNAKAYFRRAIINDIIDDYRKTKSEKAKLERYTDRCKHTEKVYRPDIIIAKAEETENVFAVVETKLSNHEAKAVNLKFKDGCSSKEAAEQLGIKRQSVNRYITSSFKKLRSIFKVNHHS